MLQRFLLLFCCFIVLGSILLGQSILIDQGVLWHIKSGELIYNNLAIPIFDPFLFWGENLFWLSDQWLSDLLLYLVISNGDVFAITLFTELILVSAFFVIPFFLSQKLTRNLLISIIVAFICSINATIQWFCRPFIFAFLFFNLTYFILWLNYKSIKNNLPISKLAYCLPLIFCLWANMHPSFILGFFLFVVFLGAEINYKNIIVSIGQNRIYIGIAILSFVATFINPYGYKLYIHIFELVTNSYFTSLFYEWQAVNFQNNLFIPFILTLFFIIINISYFRKSPLFSKPEFIIFLVLLLESLLHCRYIMFWIISLVIPLTRTFIALADNIDFKAKSKSRIHNLIVRSMLVLTSLLIIKLYNNSEQNDKFSYPKNYPLQAIRHIEKLNIPNAKILNNMNWGGIVTYFLYPQRQAFIDDRASLIGEKMFKKYSAFYNLEPNWEDIFKEFGFDIILLPPKIPATTFLKETKYQNWVVSYEDEQAVVFVKN
ncbi:MAG: hypothetical protein LBF97_04660 [Elusimicrobiota bacterium]|jgi:hypothetical protein|nr:hypothetical protein [Elusimicrobiota bacterium]